MSLNMNTGIDLLGSASLNITPQSKAPVVANTKGNAKADAILVDNSSSNNEIQTKTNAYQPMANQDVIAPSPESLQNLLTKFEQFQTQFPVTSTAPVSGSDSDSNDATTIAMIMWILQELLPKLMLIMNKLNMSFSELSASNFALEVANAKISLQYSIEANKQTKDAAMQSFTAEMVGASVDTGAGVAGLINTVRNNQTPVEKYQDHKASFDSLKEKNDLLQPILGTKIDINSNPQVLKSLLTEQEQTALDTEVKNRQKKLTETNLANNEQLKKIDRQHLTGVKAEKNLTEDMNKIGKVDSENIIDITKQMKASANKASIGYADIESELPKLSRDKIENHAVIKKFADGYGVSADDIFSKPIIKLDNGQTLAMIPDGANSVGLYLIEKDSRANNPHDTFVKQATVKFNGDVFINDRITGVNIVDNKVMNAFTSGKIYNSKDLGSLKGLIKQIDATTLTADQAINLTNVKALADNLHTTEDSGLFKNGKINILSNGKIYELDADFDNNGKVNIRKLDEAGTGLETHSSVTIPAKHIAQFKSEYEAAQAFTIDNLELHIGDAKLIKAYVNSNRPNSNESFVGKIKARVPELARKALLAQSELETNKAYVDETSKYLDGIESSVNLISKKITYRFELAKNVIAMTSSASRMGTAGLVMDAKNQEADARLLESFAQVMGRVMDLMSKTSNSYTDDFAKFLKELRDAIAQQLVSSSQLLTRFYGTR